MYRVLIVDDDLTVRIRLKNLISWELLECEIAGEATHGLEAIALLDTLQPDIVITDIYMPGMNGVDLIHYIREHAPEIYVLALSAYDDFDYVRNSLRYGAFDYLLKHQLTASRLEQILEEATTYLGKRREGKKERKEHLEEKTVLEDLLKHSGRQKEETGEMSYFLLAAGQIADGKDLENLEHKKLHYMESIVTETLLFYDWKIQSQLYQGQILVLFEFDREPVRQDVLAILNQVSANIKRFIGIRMLFQLSEVYRQITETASVFQKLERIEKKIEKRDEKSGMREAIRLEKIRELEHYTKTGKKEQVFGCLEEILEQVREKRGTTEERALLAVEICNILQRNSSLEGKEEKVRETLLKLQTESDFDCYKTQLVELYRAFLEPETDAIQYDNPLVNKAVSYIQKNFQTTVSLQEVADAMSLNAAYLSRIFKKYTGKTIVTYINDLKMEKARALIKENQLSLKEIALEVGIQNYNYFYQMVKKHYGKSPSDL